MNPQTVSTMVALIHSHPVLLPLMQEHLEDNGEMLPHLLLSDVVRWMVRHLSENEAVCRSILQWLDTAYEGGPECVRELLVVSGVEMLPYPWEKGSELRQLLGPNLKKYDQWAT